MPPYLVGPWQSEKQATQRPGQPSSCSFRRRPVAGWRRARAPPTGWESLRTVDGADARETGPRGGRRRPGRRAAGARRGASSLSAMRPRGERQGERAAGPSEGRQGAAVATASPSPPEGQASRAKTKQAFGRTLTAAEARRVERNIVEGREGRVRGKVTEGKMLSCPWSWAEYPCPRSFASPARRSCLSRAGPAARARPTPITRPAPAPAHLDLWTLV